MLISILTPTKNRATSFLPDLLRSIESQKLPNDWQLEHVICDDGSTSKEVAALRELLTAYSIPTQLIELKTSKGVAHAHNQLLKAAKGTILMDIDDDDMLTPNSIELRVRHLLNSEHGWSAGNAVVVDESGIPITGKELIRNWDMHVSRQELISMLLDNKAWFWAGTRTYKRSALCADNGSLLLWDESFVVASDLDYWCQLVHTVGAPDFIDEFLVYWREKQDSFAINAQRSGVQASMITAIRAKWKRIQ